MYKMLWTQVRGGDTDFNLSHRVCSREIMDEAVDGARLDPGYSSSQVEGRKCYVESTCVMAKLVSSCGMNGVHYLLHL